MTTSLKNAILTKIDIETKLNKPINILNNKWSLTKLIYCTLRVIAKPDNIFYGQNNIKTIKHY